MNCMGCHRTLEVGDRYIEDTASGFIDKERSDDIDGLLSTVFGGKDGKVFYCEDCTTEGGDYLFETVYGDEGEA